MLPSSYDHTLVALSILISVVAAYAALAVAERIVSVPRLRRVWIVIGAFAMGLAIWSMHYVGMLAFTLPMPVRYDVPLVVLSIVAAIAGSGVALTIISKPSVSKTEFAVGAVCMGLGIAAMHYIGMAAMRADCSCLYSPLVVILSVAVAICASGGALAAFRLPAPLAMKTRVGTAVLMGGAICSMHYIGMAAAHFVPSQQASANVSGLSVSWLGAIAIGGVSLLLLALALAGVFAETFVTKQSNKLESSEQRYRLLFEKSLVGIYRSTTDGTILDCNRAFVNLLGQHDRSEVVGLSLTTQILTADSRDIYFNFVLKSGSVASCETQITCADGSVQWVLAAGTLLQTPEGPDEVQGMFLSMQDLKRKELELQNAKIEAESASRAKAQFLANMSHELRTPLVAVLGMTDIMEFSEPTAEQHEQLSIIRESADSLLSMIGRILEFARESRLGARALAFNILEVVCEEISSVQTCSSTFASPGPWCKSCTHVCNLKSNLRLVFENKLKNGGNYGGDSGRIRRAFRAILDNAVKFTPAGEIVVTLASRGRSARAEFLVISVRDSGIGIPVEYHDTIFEPFQQADSSNTRSFGGTGLGLAAAREAIRSLGGDIVVQSEPGKGSTFTIQVALALDTFNDAEQQVLTNAM